MTSKKSKVKKEIQKEIESRKGTNKIEEGGSGWIRIKDTYEDTFRSPRHCGIYECLIPSFACYALATYNGQWLYYLNTLSFTLFALITYVRCACFSFNFTLLPAKLLFLAASHIFFEDIRQSIHFILLEVTMAALFANIKKSMTLCDMVTLSFLNAFFVMFPLDSIIFKELRIYIAGNNFHNILSFMPWLYLNVVIFLAILLNKFKVSKEKTIIISGTVALAMILALVFWQVPPKSILTFLQQVFLKTGTPKLLAYMIGILVGGLYLAGVFLRNPLYVPFYMIRKWFHLLVLYLFIPGVYLNFKMIVFAFNCVSVILILLELLRFYYFQYSLNPTFKAIHNYFYNFSDKREKQGNQMILTHNFLLIGCAFPVISNYILLSGGFQSRNMLLYSNAGILFLGIGDSMAAIMGKKQGKGYWHRDTKKTFIGSFYLMLSVGVAFAALIMVFCYSMMDEIYFIIAAVVLTGILEGITLQFDNLVCPILFYSLLLYGHQLYRWINV